MVNHGLRPCLGPLCPKTATPILHPLLDSEPISPRAEETARAETRGGSRSHWLITLQYNGARSPRAEETWGAAAVVAPLRVLMAPYSSRISCDRMGAPTMATDPKRGASPLRYARGSIVPTWQDRRLQAARACGRAGAAWRGPRRWRASAPALGRPPQANQLLQEENRG